MLVKSSDRVSLCMYLWASSLYAAFQVMDGGVGRNSPPCCRPWFVRPSSAISISFSRHSLSRVHHTLHQPRSFHETPLLRQVFPCCRSRAGRGRRRLGG